MSYPAIVVRPSEADVPAHIETFSRFMNVPGIPLDQPRTSVLCAVLSHAYTSRFREGDDTSNFEFTTTGVGKPVRHHHS